MTFLTVLWDDSPGGNVEHIAGHGLTPEEVEDVLDDRDSRFAVSKSTGRPLAFGHTRTGRHILVAFDWIDKTTVYPITAYEVPEAGDEP
ncbi:MAG: hypothetical protein WD069_03465 [Planctomycetales bacterium]